jgi:hypothetical protein
MMNADSIRELLRRQPFEPIEIHMTNGDAHLIRHPEQAWIAGARLLVHYPESDLLVICSLLHIAKITIQQAAA